MSKETEIKKVMDDHSAVLDELMESGLDPSAVGEIFVATMTADLEALATQTVAEDKKPEGLTWYINEDATKLLREGEHAVNANRFYKALAGHDLDSKGLKAVWKGHDAKSKKYTKDQIKENIKARVIASVLSVL